MTIDEVFVGALGNFLGGLATSFVAGMLQASSRRIAARFQPEPIQQALLAATEDAMLISFSNIEANADLIDHYRSIFEAFFQSEPVQDELSKLLDPHPSNTPDTNLLHNEFIKAGYVPEILPGLDFNLFISDFTHGFYIAVSKHEEFQGIIQIRLLQQQADAMISMVSLTSAISKSSSETALNVREIRRLLETQHDIPQIAVGFLGESNSMETELSIVLEETASEPDYDAIIEKKRRVLEKRGEEERALQAFLEACSIQIMMKKLKNI